MLRRWGSETRKFGLSTELIMWIDHRTGIEKLTFRALALRLQMDLLWRRANARNVSFSIPVGWSIYIINSVDKPNFYIFHDPSFSGAQKVMTLLHFPSHPPPFLLISDKSLIKNCYYYNLHTSTSVYKFKAAETKLSYVFKQMYFQVGTTCVLRSKDSSIGGCHGCHVRGQKHRNHFIKNRILFPKDGNVIVLTPNMAEVLATNSLYSQRLWAMF